MPEPTTYDEYTTRFRANEQVDGFGLDVTVHIPCPFCAAPDWLVYRVIDIEQAVAKPSMCQECRRSAMALVRRSPGSTGFEIVQVGGPDQPAWLVPKMRALPWVRCTACGWEMHDDAISRWREGLLCMSTTEDAPDCNGALEYHR